VAALVRGDQLAIDPDPGGVIDRTEMQHHPAVAPRRLEVALVPAHRVEALVADSAGLGLRRIGHLDLQGPFPDVGGALELVLLGEAEPPLAVERNPICTPQLGTRIPVFQASFSMLLELQAVAAYWHLSKRDGAVL
jgi:hypothetical protein